MSALLKVFVLREDRNAQALYAWLKQNWRAMAAAGKPLVVELKPEKTKRSLDQNARYWGLVAQVAEQASVDGKQFSAEAWHELLKREILGLVDLPGGQTMGRSTATLTVAEFAEFMTKVEAWAAQTLGVEFVEVAA